MKNMIGCSRRQRATSTDGSLRILYGHLHADAQRRYDQPIPTHSNTHITYAPSLNAVNNPVRKHKLILPRHSLQHSRGLRGPKQLLSRPIGVHGRQQIRDEKLILACELVRPKLRHSRAEELHPTRTHLSALECSNKGIMRRGGRTEQGLTCPSG